MPYNKVVGILMALLGNAFIGMWPLVSDSFVLIVVVFVSCIGSWFRCEHWVFFFSLVLVVFCLLLVCCVDSDSLKSHTTRQINDTKKQTGLKTGCSFVTKKIALDRRQPGQNVMRDPLWWAGVTMMAGGEIGNFLAYGWASAAIVSPLGAISVLVNAILASALLGDVMDTIGSLGCLLCVLGTTILVLTFPESEQNDISKVDQIWPLLTDQLFLSYLVLLLLVTFSIIGFASKYANTFVLINLTVCSTLGSLTVLSCKGVSVAVVSTLSGDNQFVSVLPFFLVFVMVACISLQLYYLNSALDRFGASVVVPIYYVMFTSCSILGSAVLYRDFDEFDSQSIIVLLCGQLVNVTGVYLISYSKRDSSPGDGLSKEKYSRHNELNDEGEAVELISRA